MEAFVSERTAVWNEGIGEDHESPERSLQGR